MSILKRNISCKVIIVFYFLFSGIFLNSASSVAQEKTVVFKEKLTYRGADITFLESQKYFPALVEKIRRSGDRIEIGMYLFKTTRNKKNYANRLVEELKKAAKRGVKVVILLDQSDFNQSINHENAQTAKKLRRYRNIEICFDSPKTQSHLKMIVVDRKWVFLGSHNLSFSALKFNHEFSVLVKSKPFAKKASEHLSRLRKAYCSKWIRR